MKLRGIALAGLLLCPASSFAQGKGYFANWDNRVRATMAHQPNWVVPLVADPSGIYQLLRADFTREVTSSHVTEWNYGNTKGLILIPWYKTELDLYMPPYIQYSPTGKDGFGDPEFQLKYRPFSRDNAHGNYSVNFALAGTISTGSYQNGSKDAAVAPSIAAGKGYGRFDAQTWMEASLPVADTGTLGRTVDWDSVAQYHAGSIFWPELEDDSTFYFGGPHNGDVQNFLLPGLMLDEFRLSHDPANRLGLLFGGGMQIATSRYHSYNHGLVFTARLNF